MIRPRIASAVVCLPLFALLAAACGGKAPPPVARPMPAGGADITVSEEAVPDDSGLAGRVDEARPPVSLVEDDVDSRSLDELNREAVLDPVFFGLDGAELNGDARRAADAAAEVLRQNPSWIVTIEGHCDERGTAEYNLALGERRAAATRAYLASLGIAADRMRTVSYGKEFPFDAAHTETAWAQNRRAHFVITAK
jgi:peptidoglycan-associated lipoprotein